MARVLIIRPGALGDTLLLGPALRTLSYHEEITLAGRRPGIDFMTPFLTNCLDYECGRWYTLFLERPDCEGLNIQGADIIVSFLTDPHGIAERGLRECAKNISFFSFPSFPYKEEKIHVAHYLASCLNKSGLPVSPEKAIEDARKIQLLGYRRALIPDSTLILHPGSGSKNKNYPPEFWLTLMKETTVSSFDTLIFLLGPAEEEWQQILIQEKLGERVTVVFLPNRQRILSLFKNASIYIGHDSGITHLAAMCGIRTIALFKNSNPIQWSPLGPHITVINNAHSSELISIIAELIKDQ